MKLSKMIASFVFPQGVLWGHRYLKRKFKRSFFYQAFNPTKTSILRKNGIFENIHNGERCFILGTDTSIEHTNVKLLTKEKKIFLSQFFLHEDYNNLNPEYHLFNSLGGHPYLDRKAILEHYKQIDEMIKPNTSLFFRYALDYDFIKKHNLFKNKKVYYIDYTSSMPYLLKDGLDATKYFYHPQGCLLAGLQLALFMGFKEIYLVGCGYPTLNPIKKYHFYDRSKSTIDHITEQVYIKMMEENKNKTEVEIFLDKNKFSERYKQNKIFISVFESYWTVKKYAELKGIKIYNSNKYGLIDIFPYKDFESLF
ncbi:hypothetical protein KAT08_02045 [Candidatus Babeliales bacterium]|nr:hypothetical protein [Candidatus Babeliales bacterium]